MARIAKSGLEYFPFDIDFFQDIKIRKLIKRQGGKAVTVYALLLCLIYKNGYYMQWDDELPFIGSELTGFDEAYISEVIKTCLSLGLFDKKMLETEQVLTSKGIQLRYCSVQRLNKRIARIDKYSLSPDENQQQKKTPTAKPTKPTKKAAKAADKPKTPRTPKSSAVPLPEQPDKPQQPALAGNAAWLKEFFADSRAENLRLLCKDFGLPPDGVERLRSLALAVINEWELSSTEHIDYSDWSRHLISSMRIKARDKSSSKNNKKQQQQPPAETAPSDYSFGGGFGGQDI